MKQFKLLLWLSIAASLLVVPTLSLSATDEVVESSIDKAAKDLTPDPSIDQSAQKKDYVNPLDKMANKLLGGLVAGLGAGFVGFIVAMLTEKYKHWRHRPKLKLIFIEDDKDYVTDTELTENSTGAKAHYVRIKVENKGREIAKQCNAYLTNVEKWNDSAHKFEPTIYCDSLFLAWSVRGNERFRSLNLPNGIKWFVDVVSTIESENEYRVETNSHMNRYKNLFKEHGKFRYTVMVSGDNVESASYKITFTWGGDWDNFDIRNC